MRVLVTATDAGGAANLAPVAALFPRQNRRVYCSDVSSRYFTAVGVDEAKLWRQAASIDSVLADWNPDAVLCGTTRYPSPDRQFVPAARSRGIFTVVVLDEWSRYAARFNDDGRDLPYLPDAICVPDQLALDEAAADGLPREQLVVTGSPALAALWDTVERFRREEPALPDLFHAAPKPWIVFLSETHAADFGSGPGACGPLGEFLGYTEHSVTEDLAAVIRAMEQPCTVIEKLHPSDTRPGSSVDLAHGQVWKTTSNSQLHPLLWHADVVVGMRSMALLESALCGVPAISYEPGLGSYPPATSARLGLVSRASTTAELRNWIGAHWTKAERRQVPRPAFAPSDAAVRVRQVVEQA